MRTRKLELGTRNLIGARVTQLRLARGMKQVELLAQLQLRGVDLSIPALSLLEGQRRPHRGGGRLGLCRSVYPDVEDDGPDHAQ